MPEKKPFHSNREGEKTYHTNTQCGPGGEIPPHNKVEGKGNKTEECPHCKKLNAEGK